MLHDYQILNYIVDLEDSKIIFNLKFNININQLVYVDVLAHKFEYSIKGSTILDTEQTTDINSFLEQNSLSFIEGMGYGWPIFASNLDELREYLIKENFKIFKIFASYGLVGWVISKNIQVEENIKFNYFKNY